MKKTLIWITIFAIAMGYLETAVVVYLRSIYYPDGFKFPLTPIGHGLGVTEFFREAATILMLIGAGAMAGGKSRVQSVAYFLYAFAIWDLFYYVFLKLLLNWPESLLTWDILFLIPMPWVGPVIAPCIVCITFITFSLLAIYFDRNGYKAGMRRPERWTFILGCAVVIFSFMVDYYLAVRGSGRTDGSIWSIFSSRKLFEEALTYVPRAFAWKTYIAGELILCSSIVAYAWRIVKSRERTEIPYSVA